MRKNIILFFLFLFSFVLFSNDEDSALTIGSYGRIGIASDLEGGAAESLKIVNNSSRIEKSPYQEIYLKYDFSSKKSKKKDIKTTLNFALAFNEDLFHYNGNFKLNAAIRNLYVKTDNLIKNFSLWVGSRMYRGDDIYLLDFWPLDNLNTVGAGVSYAFGDTVLKFHTGANRLEQNDDKNPYQLLYYTVPLRDKIGTRKVIILNRQKYITSLKLIHNLKNINLKLKFYSEYHTISSAEYEYDFKNYELPADRGFSVGFQSTFYGFYGNRNFWHFFAKYSSGLAAYGELGIPYDLSKDKKTTKAREILFATALNFEKRNVGVMIGGYLRNFLDADNNDYDNDDVTESIFNVRFSYYLSDYFALSSEISYQQLNFRNLDSVTLKQETPKMIKIAFIPEISPNGKGNYTQPKIRLIYSLSVYNDASRKLTDPFFNGGEDLTSSWGNYSHYLGINAEWWFNSL